MGYANFAFVFYRVLKHMFDHILDLKLKNQLSFKDHKDFKIISEAWSDILVSSLLKTKI